VVKMDGYALELTTNGRIGLWIRIFHRWWW